MSSLSSCELLCCVLAMSCIIIGVLLMIAVPASQFEINAPRINNIPSNNEEQRLLNFILENYESNVRPVYNASSVSYVFLGLTINHIFGIEEKNQVLCINVWLEENWFEERIRWSPEEFGGLSQLTVTPSLIWMPDIVLYNSAEDYTNMVLQTNVAIYNTGLIHWAPPVKYRSTCRIDISFFPFDDQICDLRFGSWAYDGFQIDVANLSDSVNDKSKKNEGEWVLMETAIWRRVMYYACCPGVPYPELVFSLHLRRRPWFYVYNIIVPCIMLSCLTLSQFWLPCESGEKVTLGLTIVLAYTVFTFNNSENLPETSSGIPLLAVYIICIMTISSLSVLMSVIVLNLRHHAGGIQHAVPKWLQTLAFQWIAPFLRYKTNLGRQTGNKREKCATADKYHPIITGCSKLYSNAKKPKYSVNDALNNLVVAHYAHLLDESESPSIPEISSEVSENLQGKKDKHVASTCIRTGGTPISKSDTFGEIKSSTATDLNVTFGGMLREDTSGWSTDIAMQHSSMQCDTSFTSGSSSNKNTTTSFLPRHITARQWFAKASESQTGAETYFSARNDSRVWEENKATVFLNVGAGISNDEAKFVNSKIKASYRDISVADKSFSRKFEKADLHFKDIYENKQASVRSSLIDAADLTLAHSSEPSKFGHSNRRSRSNHYTRGSKVHDKPVNMGNSLLENAQMTSSVLSRAEASAEVDEQDQDWQQVAKIFDLLFFWIISLLSFLVIVVMTALACGGGARNLADYVASHSTTTPFASEI